MLVLKGLLAFSDDSLHKFYIEGNLYKHLCKIMPTAKKARPRRELMP